MPVCNGRGDGGDHCCYIGGKVCEFLVVEDGGLPRCSLWHIQMRKSSRWRNSPAGRFMAERYPGYDCKDWPQNIPEVMENARNLCCWSED